jgi:hypothetical protein
MIHVHIVCQPGLCSLLELNRQVSLDSPVYGPMPSMEITRASSREDPLRVTTSYRSSLPARDIRCPKHSSRTAHCCSI